MPRSELLRVTAAPIRAQRRPLAASAALSVGRIGLDLARPWPLAVAVDNAMSEPQTGIGALQGASPQLVLIACGSAVVLLSVGAGLLEMTSTRLAERAAERIGADLRCAVFNRAVALSLRWHDRVSSGELVSRLTTDVGRLLDAVVALTAGLVPQILTLVGVVALLLAVNGTLAGVGLAVLPLLAVLSVIQRRQVRRTQQAARSEAGRLAGTTSDLLRNVRAVQAFGRADRAASLFAATNKSLLNSALRAVDTESRWTPVSDVVLALGAGSVLVVGGLQVLHGGRTVGELLVVVAYLQQLYAPVRSLTRLSTVLAKAGASAARVADILDCFDAVRDAPDAAAAVAPISHVQLRDVTFSYDTSRVVLQNFNLELLAGETVCLLGPSGCGKSTVLQLLLRLYDVDAGRILVDGADLRSLTQRSVREQIAFVPQDPWLLDATVAQNIAFGSRSASRAQVLDAGRRAAVDEFIDRLPFGYDSPLGEGGSRLSGGQRRRVAIARATVAAAPLVLLDEPTASLDRDAADAVIRAIQACTVGCTTLIVTHDPELARIADRVVRLEPIIASTRAGASSALLGRR